MQDEIGTTTWTYHPPGVLGALQVSTVTGPLPGVTIAYSYDALGRMIGQNVSGVAQTYAYDVLGRVTNIVNALGAFSYAYDGATERLLEAEESLRVLQQRGRTAHAKHHSSPGGHVFAFRLHLRLRSCRQRYQLGTGAWRHNQYLEHRVRRD